MLLDRLRIETSPYHQSLEKNLGLLDRIESLKDYKLLIAQLLAFYHPLEKILHFHLQEARTELDLYGRQKTPLLLSDAEFLGISTLNQECEQLPVISDFSSAIGCLYVLEGASLGGQIISKHFKKQLELDANRGLNFYIGYGQKTGLMWQKFREFVSLSALSGDHDICAEQAIESAISTFIHYEVWICTEPRNSDLWM